MTKNYENPNNAAFFFDDGTFLNLERVNYLKREFKRAWDADAGYHAGELTLHLIVDVGEGTLERPFDDAEFTALSKALRVYHSKF